MRIFTKATLQFDHPTGAEPSVVAKVGVFTDVPDWVRKSGMFILASKDGTVTEIENKKDEAAVEKSSRKQKAGGKDEKPNDDPGGPDDDDNHAGTGGGAGGEQ